LKITSVDVFLLNCNTRDWRPIVCRINTDEGIYGYGEASVGFDSGAPAAFEMIRDLAPLIIGMNPIEHEVIWEKLFQKSFWAQSAGVVVMGGISAIDMALWDIKGKVLNLPLYTLLGGKQQEKLRCYASQLQFGWGYSMKPCFELKDYLAACNQAVKEGFDAIKINFITFNDQGGRNGFLRWPIPYAARKLIESRLSAIRKEIGDHIDIIVENHARTDAVSAVEMCRIIEPYNIMYIEETITPLLIQTMKTVRNKVNIPLAGGERIYTRFNFLNFFKEDAIQIAQPDLGTCGGITEGKKICDMAYAFDTGIQLHVCGSPIAIAASLQVQAALPNAVIFEHHIVHRCAMNIELGKYDYQPENGFYSIPDLPGIGQELSEKAVNEALMKTTVKE